MGKALFSLLPAGYQMRWLLRFFKELQDTRPGPSSHRFCAPSLAHTALHTPSRCLAVSLQSDSGGLPALRAQRPLPSRVDTPFLPPWRVGLRPTLAVVTLSVPSPLNLPCCAPRDRLLLSPHAREKRAASPPRAGPGLRPRQRASVPRCAQRSPGFSQLLCHPRRRAPRPSAVWRNPRCTGEHPPLSPSRGSLLPELLL